MYNTKNSFLTILKIYLQLRNALTKILNIKLIIILKMETKNLIKNGLGKNVIKSYLLLKPMKICYNYAFCSFFPDSNFKQGKWRQVYEPFKIW